MVWGYFGFRVYLGFKSLWRVEWVELVIPEALVRAHETLQP